MKLEELHIGDVFITQPVVITREDIIEFATKYDPQSFHLDEEAAKRGIFGGLVSSGMHSLALINAEFARMNILGEDLQGGIHFEARWLEPVRPDDQIFGEFVVTQLAPRRDGRTGVVSFECMAKKTTGQTFATFSLQVIVLRNTM